MRGLPNTERTCSSVGCGARLTLANKSGRCTKHWYVPKGERKAALRGVVQQPTQAEMMNKPPAKRKPPKSNGHAKTNGTGVSGEIELRLHVRPEWLDLAWARLDVEQKAVAIAAVLEV